ncbi:CsbD-like [Pseudonocardia ammonioxydans]|uniref:CsbD-like n=1 Tax=Pseudonocardia ammonioxydans TaxID=260086 RepID=A0A1I4XNR2_PSUAM|nr:CsbD family protein [Pseudonocardia ammonioxydans]SFN27471.1 CsbD-like [Pseudonocardia ammonioxydans]
MADERTENKTEELKGKAKETVGEVTGDEELETQGKGDQVKGNLKQAGEKIKDAFGKNR